MARLILFNKPYGVLSQFTDKQQRPTLADYITLENIYPAGRLDFDSEGLMLLTDNGKLQNWISSPRKKQGKRYWVQVEGEPNNNSLAQLRQGVRLKDGTTKPATVAIIQPPTLWPRNPPIRERKDVPTTWLDLQIFEGKNRQVRRMTAAVGHPTLRLIRHQIADWRLNELQPGQYLETTIHIPKS